MKLEYVEYGTTNYYKDPVFRVIGKIGFPLRTLSEEELDGNFLCLSKEGHVFVSSIYFDDDTGYYVDGEKYQSCFNVEDLKEIQLISG